MLDSEVKIGMRVRVPDHTKQFEPTTSIVTVKRILPWKTLKNEIIYEVEGDVTDRFHRPYKCVSQFTAENMEAVEQ